MGTKSLAILELPFSGGLPTVTWTDGGQCLGVKVWEISKYSETLVQLRLEPDFNWDDGINSCLIKIAQPDGSSATIDLFHDIND